MSESSLKLPAHPSLEQLRKQAKELLKLKRDGDAGAAARFNAVLTGKPDPTRRATLTDAQFVLAREYGFENWAAIVKFIGEVNPVGLSKYEKLAAAVADAYVAGDKEAIRRVNWLYGTSFLWDVNPETMQRMLGMWFEAKEKTKEMALADARYLVARTMGMESWAALVKGMAAAAEGAKGAAGGPVFYRVDAASNTIETRGPLGESEWDVVLGLMREGGITGLRATGQMSDAVLQKLSRLDHVKQLWFDGVQMSDEGLCLLGRLGGLETLDVSGPKSQMTDKGLEVLKGLRNLKKFAMCWPQKVTDAGAVNLAGCDHLEEVNLMGTHTGDATLRTLMGKARLKKLTTGRRVTDAGIPMLHHFPMFKQWQGGEAQLGLMDFSGNVNHLLLDGPITDDGLAGMAGLDGLFGLGFFWHAKAFTSHGLEVMTKLANLGYLSVDGSKADDEAMAVFAKVPRLRMLQAQGAVATDMGFEALSRSQTLEHIWGRECPNLTGPGFAALSRLPKLRGLGVSCAKVGAAGLATLPSFPALQQLMPMDVTDAGFRHVGQCKALEKLWCMYCRETTDTATEHIAGLKNLSYYYAGRTLITDKSLEMLARMEALEKIELWQTVNVTTAGVAALARLPKLKELEISGVPGVGMEVKKAFGPGVVVRI